MLTEKTMVAIGATLRNGCTFKIVPFDWNPKTFTLTVNEQKLWITVLISSVSWLNLTYLVFSFHYHQRDSEDRTSQILHILGIFTAFLGAVIAYSNIRKRFELAIFFNQFFKYQKLLAGSFMQKYGMIETDGCEKLLRGLYVMSCIMPVVSVLSFLRNPSHSRYMYSILRSSTDSSWGVLIYALFEALQVFATWNINLLPGLLMFSYWFGTSRWLQELNLKIPGSTPLTKAGFREPRTTFVVYRCLQLLNHRWNACLAGILMPWAQLFLIILPATRMYIILSYYDQLGFTPCFVLGILIAINFIVVLGAFPVGASLNSLSIVYINSYRALSVIGRRRISLTSREVRSCKPMKVQIGSMLFIRKFTVLKVFHLIINLTMRLLIIFRVKH